MTASKTTGRETTTERLLSCFDDLSALIDDLQPDEWDVQSLCPDWTIRGVICHLAAVEHVLSGWVPSDDAIAPPFDQIGEFLEQSRSWSNEEVGVETKRILARRREELPTLTDQQFAHRAMTPVGEGTYHRFMDIRIFDFWVHQRDMTIPLKRVSVDDGPAAETALAEVHNSLGYIVGKKIGLPDGESITFHLTGPIERDLHVAVEGRAAVVDQLDQPSVEVTTDSVTFVMLACGRLDPQVMIDQGRITWRGEAEWGERAARNLRFTM